MSRDMDVIKMLALGRPFAIGMLYNYIDDAIVPNLRLWDPDVVSRLIDVVETVKSTAKVHFKLPEQLDENDVDGEEEQTLLTDLGMDDHSAVSMTAGLLRSSIKGAWQYAADWIQQPHELLNHGAQMAVHCRSSVKKVSVTPKKQLEIICRPKRLIDSQATHVVLAITYGREAFCIFPQEQAESQKSEQNDYETIMEKTRNYAYLFQSRLMNDCETFEPGRDEEDDEMDGRCRPIPKDYQCLVYSDAMAVKGGKNWTLKPVAEQYEACRMILKTEKSIAKDGRRKSEHTENAIPLKVWLYPLNKLIAAAWGKIPTDFLDVSRHSMLRCHLTLGRLQRIRSEVEKLVHQVERLADRQCIPLTICQRMKELKELTIEFISVFIERLGAWTLSIRRGTAKEEKMAEVIDALEIRSPFATNKLKHWLDHHGKEIMTLERLAHLPSVLFIPDRERLLEYLKTESDGLVAVVILLLPSLMTESGDLIAEIRCFIGVLKESSLLSSITWPEEISGHISQSATLTHRQLFAAGQQFSDWVKDNNHDAVGVRYVICYNQNAEQTFPLTGLCNLSGEPKWMDFTIPKAPEEVIVVKNRRGVIMLSWPNDDTIGLTNYLVQYRTRNWLNEDWASVRNDSNSIVFRYLQSGETYVFRVAAVTLGGRSPFSPVSCEVTVDPVCPPPTGLQAHETTDTSISISWNHQPYVDNDDDDFDNHGNGEVSITSFSVECWIVDGPHESTFIQRSTTNKSIVLEPLVPNTEYYVQVRVECRNASGSVFNSPASGALKTKTLREAERAAHIVRRSSKKCSVSPGINVYELPLKERSNATIQGVSHYVFGEPSYLALTGKRRQRTILVLGATGSGKSTLINAMANYVLGVEWEDDFRFKLINEPADKSQAFSQTDLVTTYDFYEMKGSRLDYSLTIVDTPGFGDTSGIEKDKKIMQQIQDYFKCRHGIHELEAVCFVVQSSLPRLTKTQQYIFDSILSIFGQNIKDNMRLMVTFADNDLPTILDAVKDAGIPLPKDPITGLTLHHKFNSSIFFASNQDEIQTNEVNRTYFEMAVENFDKFFDDLRNMKTKSLTLTREVLEERRRLEALVEGLQLRTQIKLARIDEFEQIKKMLAENKQQMDENKHFDFEVEFLVPKSIDISGTGKFTTNCKTCTATCHFPCSQTSDTDKHRCSVMDPNGNCRICECPWNVHYNQKYRYEMVKEKVQRSSETIRKQYQEAKAEALTNQELLAKIQAEIDQYEKQLMELVQDTSPCIQRLNEIALKPHTLSTPAYIDLLIATEKKEHRPGYQQRITTLQRLHQVAEMMTKLVVDHQIPRTQPSTSQSTQTNYGDWPSFFKSFKR